MIVHFHTHIFPDKIAKKTIEKLEGIANVKAFTDGREVSLISSMEEAGVDLSLVLPVVTKPEQFATINDFAARLNEKYQGKSRRLFSFGGIHPDSPDYKRELRTIYDLGLKGIKLHPDYQSTYFDDMKYMRILDYASELGLITMKLPRKSWCLPTTAGLKCGRRQGSLSPGKMCIWILPTSLIL